MSSKKPLLRLLALAAALSVLHGCGGGGGGGDDASAAPQTPPEVQTPETPETPLTPIAPPAEETPSTPETPQTPDPTTPGTVEEPETPQVPDTPTPPPSDPYAPVAGSEPAPSLSQPQPGSTAAVGSAWEGIYESMSGYTFITPTGMLFRKDLVEWTRGSISVNGTDWVFNSDTNTVFLTMQSVTGSGSFTPKTSMTGTYSKNGGTSATWGPLTYSQENALAVTTASLQGNWSATNATYGMSLEFDASGVFSGTTSGAQIGTCQLSGSMVQVEPGSSKNMFSLTLTAVNAATGSDKKCSLTTSTSYTGLAGIVLTPAGRFVGNGYFRTIAFNIATAQGSAFTNYLLKQQ